MCTSIRRPMWSMWVIALAAALAPIGSSFLLAQDPARLTLSDLINLGLDKQPALTAARASVASAEAAQSGINSLPPLAGLLSRDLPVRRQQACLGVTIASAALNQAEWETRYAVVRNYYSVIYARRQLALVNDIKRKLDDSIKTGDRIVEKGGDPDIKLTKIDVDILKLNRELLKTRETEARLGVSKAIAALREAIGVGPEYPLDVADGTLPDAVEVFSPGQREELIAAALANRGEMTQVNAANQVTCLEITAQSRLCFRPQTKTFAAAADIHATPIPQGVANGEYKPGATGLEYPVFFVGSRTDRVNRAEALHGRAGAVVDKTQNLIALEVDATFLKLREAQEKAAILGGSRDLSKDVSKRVKERFDNGKVTAGELMQAQTIENLIEAQFNEARYNYALALAALERVTAGGYRLTTERK